jgi:carboxypeptidase PM20D1
MLRWEGTNPALKPIVLMGHHDVVEADPAGWTHDPFGAQIEGGRIYARGALDNKALWTCLLEACDALLEQGYTPPRDIYLSSSNTEEDSGGTTPKMVEWLRAQGIEPEFVMDEGGAVIDNPPLGVNVPFAAIGVSEKGCVNTFITCSAAGGHASTPAPQNAPIRLIRALATIEDHPAPSELLPPVEAMLKELAAYSGLGLRMVFGNLWLFRPLVLRILKGNGETAAMVRTTYALTELGGSQAVNVLPKQATAGYSVRVNPNETATQAIDRLKSHLGEGFEVRTEHVTEPSPVSPFDDEDFDYLRRITHCVYPDAGIAPYIQSSGSDSRHFNAICPRVYRFAGILFAGDQRGRIHGQDENIGVDAFKRGVGFYIELIRHLDMLGK